MKLLRVSENNIAATVSANRWSLVIMDIRRAVQRHGNMGEVFSHVVADGAAKSCVGSHSKRDARSKTRSKSPRVLDHLRNHAEVHCRLSTPLEAHFSIWHPFASGIFNHEANGCHRNV